MNRRADILSWAIISGLDTAVPSITPVEADRARRYVCSRAADAADARLLLDALGLLP